MKKSTKFYLQCSIALVVVSLLWFGLVACASPSSTTYKPSVSTNPVTTVAPTRYVDNEYGVICYLWGSSLFCLKK